MRLSLLDLTLTPEERDEILANPNFLDELFETAPLQQQQQQDLITFAEPINDFVETNHYYHGYNDNTVNNNNIDISTNCDNFPSSSNRHLPLIPATNTEEYDYLKKCGEITVSFNDGVCFWLNCLFCPGVCLQFEVFMQHIREQHGQDIKTYCASRGASSNDDDNDLTKTILGNNNANTNLYEDRQHNDDYSNFTCDFFEIGKASNNNVDIGEWANSGSGSGCGHGTVDVGNAIHCQSSITATATALPVAMINSNMGELGNSSSNNINQQQMVTRKQGNGEASTLIPSNNRKRLRNASKTDDDDDDGGGELLVSSLARTTTTSTRKTKRTRTVVRKRDNTNNAEGGTEKFNNNNKEHEEKQQQKGKKTIKKDNKHAGMTLRGKIIYNGDQLYATTPSKDIVNNNNNNNNSNQNYHDGNDHYDALAIDKVNNRKKSCAEVLPEVFSSEIDHNGSPPKRRRGRRRQKSVVEDDLIEEDVMNDSNNNNNNNNNDQNIRTIAAMKTRRKIPKNGYMQNESLLKSRKDYHDGRRATTTTTKTSTEVHAATNIHAPSSPPPFPMAPDPVDLVYIVEDASSTALRHELAILDDGVEETVEPYSVMFNVRPLNAPVTPATAIANLDMNRGQQGDNIPTEATRTIDWHACGNNSHITATQRGVMENRKKYGIKGNSQNMIHNNARDLNCSDHHAILSNRDIIEYLLQAYKNNEKLWNPQHPQYRINAKQQYYNELSKPLQQDMNCFLSGSDIHAILNKLTARYRLELKKHNGQQQGTVKHRSSLWYFDNLEFLSKIEIDEPSIREDSLGYSVEVENVEDNESSDLKDHIEASIPNAKYAFLKSDAIAFATTNEQLSFIEIYRDYNTLWDVDHPDYRSVTYREKALQDMLADMNNSFKTSHTLDQLKKTIHQMRKAFKARKHKILADSNAVKNIPEIHSKLAEFLNMNLGPFQCIECGKVTKTSAQYKIHKSSHDGSTPFICTLCGRGFQLQGNLTIHIRRHKRDFPYSCGVCEKRFATSTEVTIHLRTHTGERPYICDTCGKSFKTWSFFALHQRGHQEQSNFHCPICERDFYEKNRYTDHMNRHLNIRKHCCEICNKSFTTLATLNKHFELHEKVKKYECVDCGRRFAQNASLRWHRRRGICPTPWLAGQQGVHDDDDDEKYGAPYVED